MRRSRNAFTFQRFSNVLTRKPWILPSAVGLLALVGVLVFRIGGRGDSEIKGEAQPTKSAVLDAWKSQDTQKTLDISRASLLSKPLDAFFLSFEGISAYYLSTGKPEGEERQFLLDEAVLSIRKALASQENIPVKAQVEYVLGKAYYQKGEPWYDLAVKYLELSKTAGYSGKDTEQYLGLAYVGLGMHDKAVGHFEEALQSNKNDLLMLSAAVSYKELGDEVKAKEMLSQAVIAGSDAVVTQKARYLLAEMAYKKDDLAGAKALYSSIVDADPASADAWYWLGVIYDTEKDPIKARAAWRKATAINPNHIEARKKLAERL
ncbi:MAG: tetratricopeptide repeat protein [Spirochaetes bacterium]|nr:tetratricopeptide repeat protein [Spirochaetota bacterium]